MLDLAYKLGAAIAKQEFARGDSDLIQSLTSAVENMEDPIDYSREADSDTREQVPGDVTSPVSWGSKAVIRTSKGN